MDYHKDVLVLLVYDRTTDRVGGRLGFSGVRLGSFASNALNVAVRQIIRLRFWPFSAFGFRTEDYHLMGPILMELFTS